MSDKPRIICLHGGGANARIFELQMRRVIISLQDHFRFVFVEGPWTSELHPDLKVVYGDFNPGRRWCRWLPQQPHLEDAAASNEVERVLVDAMDRDEGSGEWVGILGFSQGARMAFSILLENQLRMQNSPPTTGFAGVHWQFGVIMAGRGAPFGLSDRSSGNTHYAHFSQLPGVQEEAWYDGCFPDRLRTPTLHVHGLQDPGLELHRALLTHFASPEHARLIEWNGAHRIPLKTADVKLLVDATLEIAKVSRTTIIHAQSVERFADHWLPSQSAKHGRVREVVVPEEKGGNTSIATQEIRAYA
ncbi:citrinin biosynthesis oxidoreductase CtnB [Seiridium cupressi]